MTATDSHLAHISDLVMSALADDPPGEFRVEEVTSEVLPFGIDDEYVRTTVVLDDSHPSLDPRALNLFSLRVHDLCAERGLDSPAIIYTDRRELQ